MATFEFVAEGDGRSLLTVESGPGGPVAIAGIDGKPIDWHATMRDCVAEASVLADRIGTRDSEAGEAIQRLCNATAHLLDEGEALKARADTQARLIHRITSILEAVSGHINAENGL